LIEARQRPRHPDTRGEEAKNVTSLSDSDEVEMKVVLSEDATEVALLWPAPHPGFSLNFTAEELERFIEILIEVRTHMQPPVSRA
jgi:hypothetical protein